MLRLSAHVVEYLKFGDSTRTLTAAFALLILLVVFRSFQSRRPRTTRLRGPPSQSYLFGVTQQLEPSPDIGLVYQAWERDYGSVYEIPAGLSDPHIVLGDPKAVAHVYSNDTTIYQKPELARTVAQPLFGDLIAIVEGDTHKRLRKVMSAAFSNSAIRDLTPVFFDCAHKLKAAWESSLKGDSAIIEVQKWMNDVALDSIGKAGFSHDFGALRGETSPLVAVFNSLSEIKPALPMMLALLLGPLLRFILPIMKDKRQDKLAEIAVSLKAMATELLDNARKESENSEIRSILGVLIKSENASPDARLSTDEIIAQNMFMTAGYDTTALTLTWGLIELARHQEIQRTLRDELRDAFAAGDPTYDQLMNDLPYLDAFTCELLRTHLAAPETMRDATEDDTIPLTNPIRTASGKMVDSLFVKKGAFLRIPSAGVNISEGLWGKDSTRFDPSRWFELEGEKKEKLEEVKGYRHLLTFAYGPRMCPGRYMAVTEIKVVIAVLIHHFSLEFPDGPSTKIESHFLRPKVAGENGSRIPLLVRRAV